MTTKVIAPYAPVPATEHIAQELPDLMPTEDRFRLNRSEIVQVAEVSLIGVIFTVCVILFLV